MDRKKRVCFPESETLIYLRYVKRYRTSEVYGYCFLATVKCGVDAEARKDETKNIAGICRSA